jgi:hypothetical protein
MPDRTQAQQTDLARQKIQTYRSQANKARTHAYNQPGGPVQLFYVPTRDGAERPSQVVVGGQILHLVPRRNDSLFALARLTACNKVSFALLRFGVVSLTIYRTSSARHCDGGPLELSGAVGGTHRSDS